MASDSEPPPATNPVDTQEFFFPGAGISALLVHGLTGTPFEMRYLGERLAAAGVRVFAARLAGHASSAEALGATNHFHWYESVVDGCERLRAFGDPIVVIGQSAGAVLAARLAIEQREAISGVVLLAPAFFLTPLKRAALALLAQMGPRVGMIYLRNSGADIYDAAARQIHPTASLMPLGAAISLLQLSALVRPTLGRLTQPTLIFHSRHDHVCPWRKNSEFLMNHLGGAHKRLVVLERSYHVVSVDIEKQLIAGQVANFAHQFARDTPAALHAAAPIQANARKWL